VLAKYKVGVGRERFTNEDGHTCDFDAIYFPMYAPRTGSSDFGKASMQNLEHELVINSELTQIVKMKVRAAYPEHKSKMRIHPSGSSFQ
jgi:hypothetical protein